MELEPLWAVAANIIKERPYGPGGKEIKYGTKHFRPGAKVYIIHWYSGMGESVTVVGLGRKPRKLIAVTVRIDWVENLRKQLIYSHSVIRKIKRFFIYAEASEILTKENVKEMYEAINSVKAYRREGKEIPNAIPSNEIKSAEFSFYNKFKRWILRK